MMECDDNEPYDCGDNEPDDCVDIETLELLPQREKVKLPADLRFKLIEAKVARRRGRCRRKLFEASTPLTQLVMGRMSPITHDEKRAAYLFCTADILLPADSDTNFPVEVLFPPKDFTAGRKRRRLEEPVPDSRFRVSQPLKRKILPEDTIVRVNEEIPTHSELALANLDTSDDFSEDEYKVTEERSFEEIPSSSCLPFSKLQPSSNTRRSKSLKHHGMRPLLASPSNIQKIRISPAVFEPDNPDPAAEPFLHCFLPKTQKHTLPSFSKFEHHDATMKKTKKSELAHIPKVRVNVKLQDGWPEPSSTYRDSYRGPFFGLNPIVLPRNQPIEPPAGIFKFRKTATKGCSEYQEVIGKLERLNLGHHYHGERKPRNLEE